MVAAQVTSPGPCQPLRDTLGEAGGPPWKSVVDANASPKEQSVQAFAQWQADPSLLERTSPLQPGSQTTDHPRQIIFRSSVPMSLGVPPQSSQRLQVPWEDSFGSWVSPAAPVRQGRPRDGEWALGPSRLHHPTSWDSVTGSPGLPWYFPRRTLGNSRGHFLPFWPTVFLPEPTGNPVEVHRFSFFLFLATQHIRILVFQPRDRTCSPCIRHSLNHWTPGKSASIGFPNTCSPPDPQLHSQNSHEESHEGTTG